MGKITVEQLMAKMSDLSADDDALAEYFIVDEENSGPFAPRLKLNPATVQIPRGADAGERSAMAMNSANWLARWHRKGRYQQKIAAGYDGPRIVSEGDSWFQYPVLLTDTIDYLMKPYAVYSLGAAGDLLKSMADKQEYVAAIRETGAEILLLSGGGNDLVAGGALASHLEEFDPDLMPQDYLLPSFHALLDDALKHYGRMFTQVHQLFPHVSILCHGYDYPVPNKDRWLGKPMEARGIRDKSLQKAVARCMMDEFNRRLRRAAKAMPNVTYIDCRNTVGDHRWHDGLHPDNGGYADVARKFAREITKIANARSGPSQIISGPFGTASELSRAMQAPAVIAGGAPKGISLHVGLNTVDPAHYDGWDGHLKACEADAHAMLELASSEGFSPEQLLTQDATRGAVVDHIKKAASDLKAGDMFLFTVSAHGGRLPDFNQDEDHDGDIKMDETLCLYDFQIADDELYMLWSEFKPGVRVLMVPDTCHSGSMARMGSASLPMQLWGRVIETSPASRAMPRYVEERVWRANEAAYRTASKSYSALKESVMMSPLSSPIRASVLNLGACKDEQFAMDGDQNGAFTGALLGTWDGGRFSGGYHAFRSEIEARIGSPSQTPQLFEKLLREPNFVNERPFTLQPHQHNTANTATSAPPVSSPGASQVDDTEGDENDPLADAEVSNIFEAKSRGAGLRSSAALGWSDYADFDGFIKSLGLKNFATDEFLILGGSHNDAGSACAGKNTYPLRGLWTNIAKTAQVLDHLRDRLGKPIAITNAYRAPAYNACIGGAASSQHMKFTALDFKVSGMSAPDVAQALRWLRDKEGFFKGGIGRYNGFTHVDTRGHNATWPKAFANSNSPASSPLLEREPRDLTERLALINSTQLAAPRGGMTRSAKTSSSFAAPATRSGDPFDPESQVATHQQNLKAAVSASSVISFVENLTPGQKEDVLLSTLFAQRAADAKADPIKSRETWFAVYTKVLSALGWVRENTPFEASHKMQAQGSFDQVILTTLAQIATGNQFKIIESAIEALRGLTDDDGKIKLFDLETSSTKGGNFQIGSAEATGDVISMAIGAFNFSYLDKKQNILFVSWGKNELDYWLSAQQMTLSPTIYDDVRDIVKSKLADTRRTLIADIEI
ncbi:D-Ala-D-Ala carboxypeptidase family metallohydrolase [Litoreibacter arenae]|uniref:Peptidase C14, caspase catalytic subunit p20 n=1 Tax=Litoreibacter arenae DSM 19593 TaxID=1123360 RepID=S9QC50_9RHOB|nr:D-Ala-D-Ala carboxypeptidase family metallohydrolase [Litoreibacter arenae]EPX77153.1 peptidase C14, caspase catalytic subunit p20 [Litoreibacter arenae DSM 19593]